MRLNYPENLSFTCNNCGKCCGDTQEKTRHILLLKTDAERIAKYTGQTIAAFAQETKDKAPYIYGMQKNPETGKCRFHRSNQCTIYTVRPLICRFYPFELTTNENGEPTFKATDECPTVSSLSNTKNGKHLTKRYFQRLLALARKELNCELTGNSR